MLTNVYANYDGAVLPYRGCAYQDDSYIVVGVDIEGGFVNKANKILVNIPGLGDVWIHGAACWPSKQWVTLNAAQKDGIRKGFVSDPMMRKFMERPSGRLPQTWTTDHALAT